MKKMFKTEWLFYYTLAGVLRFLLMKSRYQEIISDRVEVSTSLNSWKRVTEGVHLRNFGIDPYSGDLFHETPLCLEAFSLMQKFLTDTFLKLLFILTDFTTAWLIAMIARNYFTEVVKREEEEKKFNKSTDKNRQYPKIPGPPSMPHVAAVYLFNPFIILNCVGLTTTVFTNFLFAIALFSMIKRSTFFCCLTISILTLQGLYPVILMVPATIYIVREKNEKDKYYSVGKIIFTFAIILSAIFYISYRIIGSLSFFENTIGFILTVPDLRPNIGLYWYFFTEMFEHFRWLFIASFQINVNLLYVVPLALKLRRDPMLLAFSYLAIAAIFKSYPSIGDVGFYMSLLPLWKHLFQHMQQIFIVGCFMLFCTAFAPTVWHLWIFSRSANANFYFGVTLAFAIAQIFLLTDVLFASVKREFSLRHGLHLEINGEKAKLLLE
ncbi:phosphatidylinositol glycan anchor biosynthesis class U protein [Leptopilina heterotoma]|uniref:phosphatidylinositol glycan anchor biosynthesis class U protein n=1 Tax=Leptopilina heterotoma TaxID=63436 RepID=UPI001CA9F555|nr:phosphatidylinositol glycan anchor biosynthesis class U protein [Leptopilina heterotoma]